VAKIRYAGLTDFSQNKASERGTPYKIVILTAVNSSSVSANSCRSRFEKHTTITSTSDELSRVTNIDDLK